jgi:hypothetical protein
MARAAHTLAGPWARAAPVARGTRAPMASARRAALTVPAASATAPDPGGTSGPKRSWKLWAERRLWGPGVHQSLRQARILRANRPSGPGCRAGGADGGGRTGLVAHRPRKTGPGGHTARRMSPTHWGSWHTCPNRRGLWHTHPANGARRTREPPRTSQAPLPARRKRRSPHLANAAPGPPHLANAAPGPRTPPTPLPVPSDFE